MTPPRVNIAARLLEVAVSMTAFFGVTPTVQDYHVETYQQFAVIGIAAAVMALVVSYVRGRGKALYWHSCVGIAMVVSLAIFRVALDPPTTNDTPDGSTSRPNPTVCHSGGSNAECVGG